MADPEQGYDNPPKPVVDALGGSEPVSDTGVATRAARRAKNKKNADEGIKKEEHIELKESAKPKRGTALSNAVNKRAQIQIGKAYQAPLVPHLDPNQAMDDEDRDVQIWHNDPDKVDEVKLDEFLDESVGVYRCQMDKALYILQLAGYDMAMARKEIRTRKFADEEWSDDDKILFRMAYQQYGKNFSKINQVIPYRSTASVIQYYYHVKKRWKDKSHIQDLEAVEIVNTDDPSQEERRSKRANEFFPGFRELPKLNSLTREFLEGICSNCAKESNSLRDAIMDKLAVFEEGIEGMKRLCLVCSLHYEFVGKLPETDFVQGLREREQKMMPCPAEYVENMEGFNTMSTYINDASRGFKRLSGPIPIRAMHKMKTRGSILKEELKMKTCISRATCLRMEASLDKNYVRTEDLDQNRNLFKDKAKGERTARKRLEWSDQEKFFAIHAFGRYGVDFEAVANIIGTKSIAQANHFYLDHKETIDKMIAKRENPVNLHGVQAELDKIEVEWKQEDEA